MSTVVKFNVGGQLKEITQETLEKSPVFESIFRDYPETITDNRIPFVDRDPAKFDDVVLYLGWGVLPDCLESIYELDHYGILLEHVSDEEGTQSEAIEERANALAEQIVSNTQPYAISACGKLFVTTKERLMRIDYFRGVLQGGFKQRYQGTPEDPYRLDIPALVFDNILQHLRDARIVLTEVAVTVLEKFGGFGNRKEEADVVDPPPAVTVSVSTNSSGALLQMLATGIQDRSLHCTDDDDDIAVPTLWKSIHKRVTNASVERLAVPFSNNVASIPRSGDLIYQCYLRWKFTANGVPFNVAKLIKKDPSLIYKLVDCVELNIGGQHIERLEGYQLYMLSLMDKTEQNKNGMLDPNDLTLHLPFPFCLDTGRALPLIALQYHNVEVVLKPRALPLLQHVTATPELLISYTYLDTNERRRFAKNPHEYLLPLLHRSEKFTPESCTARTSHFKTNLLMNYPTRALFITLHADDSLDSLFNPLDDLVSYRLDLNNHTRTEGDRLIAKLNKIDCKIAKDNNHVYVIPFALEPLNGHQPTMSLNMSRIPSATLFVTTSARVKFIRVWGNYWNVLRIMAGMGGLMYGT